MQEARKLKSSHENVELLKEKLLEEKNRREKAESDLLKLSDIQLSAKKLEDELSSWKSMMKDIPGLTCANEIPIKFASLQKFVSDLVWFHFCTPPPSCFQMERYVVKVFTLKEYPFTFFLGSSL